jgi:hypothetical protein
MIELRIAIPQWASDYIQEQVAGGQYISADALLVDLMTVPDRPPPATASPSWFWTANPLEKELTFPMIGGKAACPN